MNFIEFEDVTFSYPPVEGDLDENGNQIVPAAVFEHFSGGIPGAFTSIIGPNGCGKSTLMLLASGRLVPSSGKVRLLGQDIASLGEEQRCLLASVIYQNMEFESNDKVENLLSFVYKNGALKANSKGIKSQDLFSEVVEQFELSSVMNHGLSEISKGENQRILLAFSLLYGSAGIFMDEPMFAMENRQKESALEYLRSYSQETKTPMFLSMHELDLSKKYSEKVLLIHPNKDMSYGTPDEVMTSDELEKAYGIPAAMLKHSEDMTREILSQQSEALSPQKKPNV
ncbi:ATP-binding cassette domain-containing protein [Treponema sp.]|uniref:ATP-binding cassette domain-containing protein n=1 Tax=Treponema sp. TaxID=166 RepID=UPI003EFC85A8